MSIVRILIVDDQAAVRNALRSLLSACPGWSVCGEAADGLEAVELAKSLKPDVILMDVSMPRMDGFRATDIILRNVPDTRVIVISQNEPSIIAKHAAEIGARACIAKFQIGQDLIPTIENVLEDGAEAGRSSARRAKRDNGAPAAAHHWLSGGGEMSKLIRATDWSKTPLGSVEKWSPTLRMMVTLLLANRFPELLWWGPHYIQLYNDAYSSIPGSKHPKALGQPAEECWPEIWRILKPLIDTPFHGGPATWIEDIELELHRSSFTEETHFTIAYSPVPDDAVPNGIAGVLATVHEITEKVVAQRRVGILRELGAHATEGRTAGQACSIAAETLARHPKDIPFALIYLLDPDRKHARLAAAAAAGDSAVRAPLLPLEPGGDSPAWPAADAIRTEQLTTVENLASRFTSLPPGPWADPPRTAVIVPIPSNKAHDPAGLLIYGVSSRLALDSDYRAFFQLTAAQIATGVANARAYEEEKKRAEALAELDRAKTTFFSNVSHEFRTPLTLLLGPLEDALANSHGILPLGSATDLALSHRNALRLLKLVNTLLDFSRIEAGRVQASYNPVDLAALTADLASNFRSACDKAGLRLTVDCPPLPEPVFVDRDMWEKIVLNLLSNAFKFTLRGEIEIRLAASDHRAVLTVRDTGIGIPSDEIPRMFERFHRIPQTRGRTHEGTGIGLALVQELVKLHGGDVAVQSEFSAGSVFTVRLPFGSAHLDPRRIGKPSDLQSTSIASSAFVEEALRWLPDSGGSDEATADRLSESILPLAAAHRNSAPNAGPPARVLWADDNADMRAYVARLLGPYFEVESVADGEAALEAARKRAPDLVLSDMMMPRLDGFGLLRQLRADPRLRDIPVILLSARAGEESRIEGVEAGADDYLIKPFSARELLARVDAHLKMSRLRREATLALQESRERYRALSESLDAEVRARTSELDKRTADLFQTTEQLRELSNSLLTLQEQERRHVARELHDSAGNILTLLSLSLAKVPAAASEGPAALQRVVEENRQIVQQLGRELRTMSYLLHPPLLEENGLRSAVRWYADGLTQRSGLKIQVAIPADFPRLPREMELMVFRLLQECLTNVHRHSGSLSAEIGLQDEHGALCLEVRDHGRGMSPEKLAQVQSQGYGVGIRGMRERLRHFGGEMAIQSDASGTIVSARIPLAGELPAHTPAVPRTQAAS